MPNKFFGANSYFTIRLVQPGLNERKRSKFYFEREKKRLIDYINKTQALGTAFFEGKESNSFGNLTANEWNNTFYKHLDHHLQQFNV